MKLRHLRHPDRRDSADRHDTNEAAAGVHDLLDGISFLDPTQIADALNTAVYAAGTADEFIHVSLTRLARGAALIDDAINRAVADASDQFGDAVIARVPIDWPPGIANGKGVDTSWFDPDNPKGAGIRIDRRVPNSPFRSQRVDHVLVHHNGRVIGRDGQPMPGGHRSNPAMSHIPLEEWLRWRTWDAP